MLEYPEPQIEIKPRVRKVGMRVVCCISHLLAAQPFKPLRVELTKWMKIFNPHPEINPGLAGDLPSLNLI
jgi:hypothetical protein